jgi:hypothetical protein
MTHLKGKSCEIKKKSYVLHPHKNDSFYPNLVISEGVAELIGHWIIQKRRYESSGCLLICVTTLGNGTRILHNVTDGLSPYLKYVDPI